MNILAKPLGYLLSGIFSLVGNYGIALIILTVIVKICLYPLYKRQILSTAGMADIQPKIKDLQNKYRNDQAMLNQKMQELYKEENIKPMAGCLPMIIQLIIIWALFALVRNPIAYISTNDMMFASHESFLWINDLAQPDPWILPILAGFATFVSSFLQQRNGGMPGTQPGGQGKGMTIIMTYAFPILIIWLAKTYPAGLALYWFVSQFIQIFYNMRFSVLRRRMAEEKMNKKHPKRKPVRAGEGVRR